MWRKIASYLWFQGKKESRGVVTSKGRTRVTLLNKSTYSIGLLFFVHKSILGLLSVVAYQLSTIQHTFQLVFFQTFRVKEKKEKKTQRRRMWSFIHLRYKSNDILYCLNFRSINSDYGWKGFVIVKTEHISSIFFVSIQCLWRKSNQRCPKNFYSWIMKSFCPIPFDIHIHLHK